MAGVDLRTRGYRGRVVVALHGELDVAAAAGAAAALAALAARAGQLIIDLAGLEFIDCSGLAALAGVRRQARRAGGDVLLAAPEPQLQRIPVAAGLTHVFSVHASVREAAAGGCGPAAGTAFPSATATHDVLSNRSHTSRPDDYWPAGPATFSPRRPG
jgi:anti-anti-sigma factor